MRRLLEYCSSSSSWSATGSNPYVQPNEWIIADVVIDIFKQHEWSTLGCWARTCKGALRSATQRDVLVAIIRWVHADKGKERRLPRWLLYSLPHEWIWPIESQKHVASKVLPQCRVLLSGMPQKVLDVLTKHVNNPDNLCLTGGFVTRLLYEKEWYSDFDLFCSVQKSLPIKEKRVEIFDPVTNKEWDIVLITLIPTHRLFEEFDLSIVQHGYCPQEDRFYTTPLALYTYLTRDIVVTPTYRTISYFGGEIQAHIDYEKPASDLWGNIVQCEQMHGKKLHECDRCVFRSYAHHRRWRRRVQRYALRRFAGFTTSYCRQSDGDVTLTDNKGVMVTMKRLSNLDVGIYED